MFYNLERADFEEQGAKDFRRLTNSQAVGLKYGEIVVKVKKVHKNGDKIVKIDVEAEPAAKADKVCILEKRQKIIFFSAKSIYPLGRWKNVQCCRDSSI